MDSEVVLLTWILTTGFQGFGRGNFKDWIEKLRVDHGWFSRMGFTVFHGRTDGIGGFSRMDWRFPVFSKICFYT
jgi:hypothetical protein